MENKDTKAAFIWIINILKKHNVIFRITGGFAAKIYGSNRELADIDIDVPENKFKDILSDVKNYIIFGPKKYLDENWDLQLITLKYKGQEIDICSDRAKIFNKETGKWQKHEVNFLKSEKQKIYGAEVPIITKDDLIKYKKVLSREVDLEDIRQLTK